MLRICQSCLINSSTFNLDAIFFILKWSNNLPEMKKYKYPIHCELVKEDAVPTLLSDNISAAFFESYKIENAVLC
jgi:hypothetical protein